MTSNLTTIDYSPYGKILREFTWVDPNQPIGTTGSVEREKYLTTQHERDQETGLDYRGARYYNSDVALFIYKFT